MALASMLMMQHVSTSHAQQRDWENPYVFGINKLPYHATLQLPSREAECEEIVSLDGQWQPLQDELADWDDGLETIGRKRIICFPTVTATALRMTITESLAQPVISRMSVFLAPDITPDIADAGEKKSSDYYVFFPGFAVNGVKSMFIELSQTQTINRFNFLPDETHREGMPLEYILWNSTDGGNNWTQLARGEFSNIVNNPIWQKITFEAQEAKLLRLDVPRITSGESIFYDDLEAVLE